jgi:hypothetical protein
MPIGIKGTTNFVTALFHREYFSNHKSIVPYKEGKKVLKNLYYFFSISIQRNLRLHIKIVLNYIKPINYTITQSPYSRSCLK